jgi:gluconokinase
MNKLPLMPAYPKSPNEMVGGMMYFPRMLDKIRLHARGELPEPYTANMGIPRSADGACLNFLRINYDDLKKRVAEGGSDEEILEWCYQKGRRLNQGDLTVWNEFMRKFGWKDFASPILNEQKRAAGISDRADIETIGQFIDWEEGRLTAR